MKIGIAGPIETVSFRDYLPQQERLRAPCGMGGTAVNNLVLGLLELGHEVSIYTLEPGLEKPMVLRGDGLVIYFGSYRSRARYRMLDLFEFESEQIAEFIRQDQPEIVHAHWGYEFANGAIESGLLHLITLRDDPRRILRLKKSLYRLTRLWLNNRVMRKGQNFSVNSPYLAERLGRLVPVVPNSVSENMLLRRVPEKDEVPLKILSLLTGWGNVKNADTALEAFGKLRSEHHEKVEYHLYGPEYGPGETAEKWAQKNQLTEGVTFHGQVDHVTIPRILDESHLLLHPSREESFGNTLVEAMSRGVPVVAGKNSGAVPWVLEEGRCGRLVDVESAEEMALVVGELIARPEERKALAERSLRSVRERFSNQAVTEQYLELYRNIIHNEVTAGI